MSPIALIFGLVLSLSTVGLGNELCRSLLPMIAKFRASDRPEEGDQKGRLGVLVADRMTENAMTRIGRVEKREDLPLAEEPDVDLLIPLMKLVDPNHETTHTFDRESGLQSDSTVVLKLPAPKSKTVWDALEVEERIKLVKELTYRYGRGKYTKPRRGNDSFFNSMDDAKLTWEINDPTYSKPAGLVPGLYLGRAAMGGVVGVCRHSNCSLAGHLGELGIAQKDLRLVIGGKESDANPLHIWVEFRAKEDGDWVEADATGTNLVDDEYKQLELFNFIMGRKPKPNREKYPLDHEIISDFLTPVQSDVIKVKPAEPLSPEAREEKRRIEWEKIQKRIGF